MQITMFTADCTGQAANCSYPNRRVVTTPEEMQKAATEKPAEKKPSIRKQLNELKADQKKNPQEPQKTRPGNELG